MEQNELKTNIDFAECLILSTDSKANSILKHFEEFLGHKASWGDMTDENLKCFKSYILDKVKNNTASTYCLIILSVLKDNIDKCPCKNPSEYLYFKFDVPTKGLYLTKLQLDKFDEYEPKSETEMYSKRLFMLMCYIGCSLKDALSLDYSNYSYSTNTIFYTTEKNRIDVSVPASNRALKYLKQDFKNKDIHVCDKTIINTLRRIANNIGIEDTFVYTDGTTKRVADYIDISTARKTFATILYQDGNDPIEIQNMMGLLLRRNVLRYIVGYVKNRMRNKKSLFNA